ncbi:MAG: FtsH protease activity modulator HflK, partial [Candidatus Methylomirabilis sp.]|nr:FtsH protease activity modulator HflK [Deltaproteobacteria bacterium]
VDVGPPAQYRGIPLESLMLTGDENIVDVWFIVQYRIKDPYKYLFAVVDPDATVRNAAESAMRSVIGRSLIDDVLTAGRDRVQSETGERLQQLLDAYDTGIQIERVQLTDVHPPQQVVAAFKDVASAREDKIKTINQADGYRNDLIPKAKGEAAQMINAAEAYRAEVLNRAEGDVSRFRAVLAEYKRAPEVTRERIYLETMEQILPRVEKVILNDKGGKDLLPILPLRGGLSGATQAAAAASEEGVR